LKVVNHGRHRKNRR